MNILVLHAHTANRGDEAAVKAMVDELLTVYPNAKITICINGNTFYPNMPKNVTQIGRMPKLHSKVALLEFYMFYYSNGKICFSEECKRFKKVLESADIVLHAPGGPSIGDIYSNVENLYLMRLNLARKLNIPYMFYAPSMGPFNSDTHTSLRKEVIKGAKKVILRDPISIQYLKEFIPDIEVEQALDSALQHDVDEKENEKKYNDYVELKQFLDKHPKCVGVTITDLKWHPKHKLTDVVNIIPREFEKFIKELLSQGYAVIYIPQLYGANNDSDLMSEFMYSEDTFIIEANNEKYDTYFQQYVIGKLFAVVGMRYHSNIFSAKMSTPFVSVSYEQKMQGFMEKMGLSEYCLPISDLTFENLNNKFQHMVDNHYEYNKILCDLHSKMKEESRITTEAVIEILEGKD